MSRDELLSSVDLSALTNAADIMTNVDLHEILDLLITKNLPRTLSDAELSEKIENVRFYQIPVEYQTEMKKILTDLAQLPTGKKLLSILPDEVAFTDGSEADAAFNRNHQLIKINFNQKRNSAERCADMAHEIRHAIQYKLDPTFSNNSETSYIFEKVIELDCWLQNRKVEREYLDTLSTSDESSKLAWKKHFESNSDYYQYTDFFKDGQNQFSPEEKERLVNTLFAINTWYGVDSNHWRNNYNDQAIDNNSFSRSRYEKDPTRQQEISNLETDIRQTYIQNMDTYLTPDFFDKRKDCTIVVNGYKLFERSASDKGSQVSVFYPNGNPHYQADLNQFDWKNQETSFYLDGLPKEKHTYNGSAFFEGAYEKYFDEISPKTGQPRVAESGHFQTNQNGGYGNVYANDDSGKVIMQRTYLPNGWIKTQTDLTAENKGDYIRFHNSFYHQVELRMTVDENGVGQGHFTTYRRDDKNTLEWSGEQIDNLWHGSCFHYTPDGQIDKEVIYQKGQEIGSIDYDKDGRKIQSVQKTDNGSITTFYDTSLNKNGEQKKIKQIEVNGDEQTETVFNPTEDIITKRRFYPSGNIEQLQVCSGAEKGKCITYYDTDDHKIESRMTIDENGVGQGYFEQYRCDYENTLEWSGTQIDGKWNGLCSRYTPDKRIDSKNIFQNGELRGHINYDSQGLKTEETYEKEGSYVQIFYARAVNEKGEQQKIKQTVEKDNLITETVFDPTGDIITKTQLYPSGKPQKIWVCSGKEKGKCTEYYDVRNKIRSISTVDENGIGQGYFEQYRCDMINSLESTGYQQDGQPYGLITKFNERGRVVSNVDLGPPLSLTQPIKGNTQKTSSALRKTLQNAQQNNIDKNVLAACISKQER